MNTNTILIDTICNSHIQAAQPPHKGGTTSGGKQFTLIQDDTSSEETSCTDVTSINTIDNDKNKSNNERPSNESAHMIHGETEADLSLKDRGKAGSEETTSVFGMHEQRELKLALWALKFGSYGKNSETGSKGKAKIQPISPSTNSHAAEFPFNTEGIMEPIPTEQVSTHKSQVDAESVPVDISQYTPTGNNHSERTENTLIMPILKPAGMPEQTNARPKMDTVEGLISNKHVGTAEITETIEKNPITSDPEFSTDTQKQPVSSTNDLFVNVFDNGGDKTKTDDGKTATGESKTTTGDDKTTTGSGTTTSGDSKTITSDGKATTTNIDLISTQARISETQHDVVEADLGKRSAINETIPELQYPKDKEQTQIGDNLSNAPGFKALNTSEFQTVTDQQEAQNRSADNNSFQHNFEQIHIQNDNPVPVIQPSFTSADTSTEDVKQNPLPEQPSPNEVSEDVGKQILESIQSSLTNRESNQQITIRLNPPELGKVFIRFQEQNSELTGLLEVNKAETRIEIEQALPQMIRELANCGVQIMRLDVMLSQENRSGYGTLEDQSLQNNGPNEQDSAGSQTQDNDVYSNGISDWLPNNEGYQHITESQEILIGDGSINVLI